MSEQATELSVGERLLALGWSQGSLFKAPGVRFQFNGLASSGVESVIGPKHSKTKSSRLILVTQTCDVRSEDEFRVEALVCRVSTNRDFCLRADSNSTRWFLVDPAGGLVAYATYRVLIEKEALLTLSPEPWPADGIRLERFRRWLARRYARPALPDPMVEHFQKPLEEGLHRLGEQHADVGRALNEAVHEFRVTMPSTDVPPFDLQLVLMIRRRLSRDQADAIDLAVAEIRRGLNPGLVRLSPGVIKVTEDQISVADFYATRPLFLDYMTYQGDEIVGTEPRGPD